MVKSTDEIQQGLKSVGYYANRKIAEALNTALILHKPLLVEGSQGAGKTSLATAVARMFDIPRIRLQMYEELTEDKILYEYNYQLQLLSLEAIKPALERRYSSMDINSAITDAAKNINFYSEEFLIRRPVLSSIDGTGRKVLLVDEIDKASQSTEYLFYEFFEDYSVSIPELGTVTCPPNQQPIVILTSNGYRELSQALKRRCVYLYIPNKTAAEMTEIIVAQAHVDKSLAKAIASFLVNLSSSSLKQKPSVAEGVDWATYLSQFPDLSKAQLIDSLGVIIKNEQDLDIARALLDEEKILAAAQTPV